MLTPPEKRKNRCNGCDALNQTHPPTAPTTVRKSHFYLRPRTWGSKATVDCEIKLKGLSWTPNFLYLDCCCCFTVGTPVFCVECWCTDRTAKRMESDSTIVFNSLLINNVTNLFFRVSVFISQRWLSATCLPCFSRRPAYCTCTRLAITTNHYRRLSPATCGTHWTR